MKTLISKIASLYATNVKFHSLVVGLEIAVASFITSYSGGLPTNKAGWTALGLGVGAAVWGAVKGWLITTVSK